MVTNMILYLQYLCQKQLRALVASDNMSQAVLMRHGLGSGLSMSRLKQMLIVVKQPLASLFNTISLESTCHNYNIPEQYTLPRSVLSHSKCQLSWTS